MSTIARACVALALSLPLGASAGSIQSSNDSFSQTGGIIAESEATASGDSDASAEIRTIIRGGLGGSARVEITTERNGVQREGVREYGIPVGSPPAGGSPQVGSSTRVLVLASSTDPSAPVHRPFLGWFGFGSLGSLLENMFKFFRFF